MAKPVDFIRSHITATAVNPGYWSGKTTLIGGGTRKLVARVNCRTVFPQSLGHGETTVISDRS